MNRFVRHATIQGVIALLATDAQVNSVLVKTRESAQVLTPAQFTRKYWNVRNTPTFEYAVTSVRK